MKHQLSINGKIYTILGEQKYLVDIGENFELHTIKILKIFCMKIQK